MKAKKTVVLAVGSGLFLVAIHVFLLWRTGPQCLFVGSDEPFARTRCRILRHMERTRTPSVAVAVARDGEILWEEGFGFFDSERQTKATPKTRYRVGLISTLFTATAVLALAEEGLVDLDAPVETYLGEVRLQSPKGRGREVTMRQILRSRSGLPRYWHLRPGEELDSLPRAAETIRRYGFLAAEPGTQFTFSSIGYSVLELVLENVSGLPFSDALDQMLFQPLALLDTAAFESECGNKKSAAGYDKEGQVLPCLSSSTPAHDGGLSSVHDLVRLGIFHLADAGATDQKVLSRDARRAMRSNVDSQTSSSMAWFHQKTYGFEIPQIEGLSPGTTASLALVPEESIAVALLANGAAADIAQIRHWILSELLPDYRRAHFRHRFFPGAGKTTSQGETLPKELVGSWAGELRGLDNVLEVSLKVEAEGSQLRLSGGSHIHHGEKPFWTGESLMLEGFQATLDLPEIDARPHTLSLRLWQTEEGLAGYALALGDDYTFCIPASIELHRASDH